MFLLGFPHFGHTNRVPLIINTSCLSFISCIFGLPSVTEAVAGATAFGAGAGSTGFGSSFLTGAGSDADVP